MTTFESKSAQPRRQARVALIGEALVDHFPDASVIGGAPFNVARNLAALGASSLLITRLGEDTDSRQIRDEFSRFSLSPAGIQRDTVRATGNVQVTLTDGQPQYYIANDQAWDAIDAAAAVNAAQHFAPTIICFGTLAQRAQASRDAIREVISTVSSQRVLDLNLRNCPDNREISEWSLEHADLVKVNDDEFYQLLAWFMPTVNRPDDWRSDSSRHIVATLMQRFGVKRLVVTRGVEGFVAYDDVGHVIAEGVAPRVDVVDTVGAGDAFLAVTLLGRAFGWPLHITLKHASAFAASVCTLRGAVSCDPAFYQPWREQFAALAMAITATSAGEPPSLA